MRFTRTILGLAAMLALSVGIAAPSGADTLPMVNYQPNITHYATADATAGYTNSTTTYTDIALATVTVPKTVRALTGTTGNVSGVAQAVEVCYWADVTKATATTGTIQIVSNAAAITASRRTTSSSAGQNTIAMCYTFARPVAAAFVVKLQGVSGDTNLFTVANVHMRVQTYLFN